ncbi:endonuclease/exonuclease/phosphatase family protein [Pontixanthobacter gangjinensis]
MLRALAVALIAGSLLSTTDLNQWWVRIWDFPRVQILVAMLVMAVLLWLFDRKWRPYSSLVLIGLAAWQLYRVHPYTPLAAAEVAKTEKLALESDKCFSVMSFNVLQKNRNYAATIEMLEREQPDILLLLETDQKWRDALAGVLAEYPEKLERPLDNTYGLLFATRLPMTDGSVQDLAEEDTPSAYATLTAGQKFRLIGLHPRPPHPGQDTEERDAEIVLAARHAKDQTMPVLAIGDFNDVGWSDTTLLFKSIGEFLDPRIGRGNFATFPADKTWLGWPLDHLFVTEEFLLRDIRVLDNVGSDHRPVIAELCLAPAAARKVNDRTEEPDAEDRADGNEAIQDYREDSAEEAN